MEKNYDFSGWATKANLRCTDGRTIMKDAFKDCDGKKVPLVWNHNHDAPQTVLGHALLENRDEGVYAYCSFNDTESGKDAKLIVQHGDVVALSIYANQLKEQAKNVVHGIIREVSLVLAGANPSAFIDSVIVHSDGSVEEDREQGVIFTGENIVISHADDDEKEEPKKEEPKKESEEKKDGDETIKEIFETLNEKQKTAVYAIVGAALAEDGEKDESKNKEEDKEMSHNIFEGKDPQTNESALCHSDGMAIVELAKANGGNSLKAAIEAYCEDNNKLVHANDDLGFKDIDTLFPEYELLKKGAPEKIQEDLGWVSSVLNKISKSPKNRLRVRYVDKREFEDRRARAYQKGTQKEFMGNLKLLGRTVDPTTIYNLDHLNRDDVQDITDFDLINYMYQDQNENLKTELARQILIGDGRNGEINGSANPEKIDDTKIIPIWTDDDLFTIHTVVDFDEMRETLQGEDTGKHFGDGYVFSEAIIQALLFARENYRGSGSPDFFVTPRLRNQMLLARDFNGRRIYDNVTDLTAALDVNSLITVEMLKDRTRTVVVDGVEETRKLLGILVNLKDYTTGMVKGGEITHFSDFDIRFNQHLSLLETRLCGMLDRPFSAIVLEEKVTNP